MADETPQAGPAPTPEVGGGAESGGEPQAAGGGGFASFLPLIIVLVLTPVLAVGTILFKSWWDKRQASAPAAEHAEGAKEKEKQETPKKAEAESSHGGSKEKGKKKSKIQRDTGLPIPLTHDAVAYREKDPTKDGDTDRYATLDMKGEMRDEAKADKIVVNIAGTSGTRFAVTRLSVAGEVSDLIERVNRNRERLLDVASGVISNHTLDDTEKPGFRNILRGELHSAFNEILGRGSIQSVIITDWAIQ